MTERTSEGDGFEAWLGVMWMELEVEYPSDLPDDFPLDFGRDSLVVLEELLLGEYATSDAVDEEEDAHFIDRTARYIGETYARAFDGEWRLGTGMYADLPVVVFPDGRSFPVSPFHLINVVAHRRTGSELTRLHDGLQEITRPQD